MLFLLDINPILLIISFINIALHMEPFVVWRLSCRCTDIKLVVDIILIYQCSHLRLHCIYISLPALPLISIYWLAYLPAHYCIDLFSYLAFCTLVLESIYSKDTEYFSSHLNTQQEDYPGDSFIIDFYKRDCSSLFWAGT